MWSCHYLALMYSPDQAFIVAATAENKDFGALIRLDIMAQGSGNLVIPQVDFIGQIESHKNGYLHAMFTVKGDSLEETMRSSFEYCEMLMAAKQPLDKKFTQPVDFEPLVPGNADCSSAKRVQSSFYGLLINRWGVKRATDYIKARSALKIPSILPAEQVDAYRQAMINVP
jgi:hypothetical protein